MHFIKPLIVVNLMQRPTFEDETRLEKKMILVQVAVTKANYKSILKKLNNTLLCTSLQNTATAKT